MPALLGPAGPARLPRQMHLWCTAGARCHPLPPAPVPDLGLRTARAPRSHRRPGCGATGPPGDPGRIRWTDGPSYEDVVELFSDSGVSCRRMERTRSAQLLLRPFCRPTRARALSAPSASGPWQGVWADQGVSTFTTHEWALAEVLAAMCGVADIGMLLSTLRSVGVETLAAVLAPGGC